MQRLWSGYSYAPFDRRLADFSFAIRRTKAARRLRKYVLKLAMQGRLPEDIVWRPKSGMSVPITDWVQGRCDRSSTIFCPRGDRAARAVSARNTSIACDKVRTNRQRRADAASARSCGRWPCWKPGCGVYDRRGAAAGRFAMKCIHCQLDSKKRANRRPVSRLPEAVRLDPTTGHPTDAAFQAAIHRVSGQGACASPPTTSTSSWPAAALANARAGCAMLIVGIGSVFLSVAVTPLLFLVGLPVLLGVYLIDRQAKQRVQLAAVLPDLPGSMEGRAWCPAGLIEPRAALPTPATISAMQSELEHYSFDRAVICRSARDRRSAAGQQLSLRKQLRGAVGWRLSRVSFRHRPPHAQAQPPLHIFACTMRRWRAAPWHTSWPTARTGSGPGPNLRRRSAPAHAESFKGLWQEAGPMIRAHSAPTESPPRSTPGCRRTDCPWQQSAPSRSSSACSAPSASARPTAWPWPRAAITGTSPTSIPSFSTDATLGWGRQLLASR